VPALVVRPSGIAGQPGSVINAVSSASGSAERREVRHAVLRSMLCRDLFLGVRRAHGHSAAHSDQNSENYFHRSFGCESCCHILAPLLNFMTTL
jgi:hypothetical protein